MIIGIAIEFTEEMGFDQDSNEWESKRCGLNNPCHTWRVIRRVWCGECVGTGLLNEWIAVLEIIIYKLTHSVVW